MTFEEAHFELFRSSISSLFFELLIWRLNPAFVEVFLFARLVLFSLAMSVHVIHVIVSFLRFLLAIATELAIIFLFVLLVLM